MEAHLELAYDGTIVAVPLWAGRLTLGRADSNNLPIKDDAVSRVHASVERIASRASAKSRWSSAIRTLTLDDAIPDYLIRQWTSRKRGPRSTTCS